MEMLTHIRLNFADEKGTFLLQLSSAEGTSYQQQPRVRGTRKHKCFWLTHTDRSSHHRPDFNRGDICVGRGRMVTYMTKNKLGNSNILHFSYDKIFWKI